MHDELKEEFIVNKVGGRFKLSTLIQKRLVQLNGGARPLVATESKDKMQIALQEVLQDKIFLDAEEEVREGVPPVSTGESVEFDLSDGI